MAGAGNSKTAEDATATDILPKAILGESPIFQAVRTDSMPAVRNLAEAGLTRVVFVSTDRRGKFHVKVSVVSQDARDTIVGLLSDEHVA